MKFELVDVAVAIMALLMLASFAKLGNIAFMLVFAVLIIAEAVGIFIDRKKKSKTEG